MRMRGGRKKIGGKVVKAEVFEDEGLIFETDAVGNVIEAAGIGKLV